MWFKKKKQEEKKPDYIIVEVSETFKLKRADITLTLTDGVVLRESIEETCLGVDYYEYSSGGSAGGYAEHKQLENLYKSRLSNLHVTNDLLYFAAKSFPSKNVKLIELTSLQDPWKVVTVKYKKLKELNERS